MGQRPLPMANTSGAVGSPVNGPNLSIRKLLTYTRRDILALVFFCMEHEVKKVADSGFLFAPQWQICQRNNNAIIGDNLNGDFQDYETG